MFHSDSRPVPIKLFIINNILCQIYKVAISNATIPFLLSLATRRNHPANRNRYFDIFQRGAFGSVLVLCRLTGLSLV